MLVALLTVVVQLGEILLELALVIASSGLILTILALFAGYSVIQPLDLLLKKLLALLVRPVINAGGPPVRQTSLLLLLIDLFKRIYMLLEALILNFDGVDLIVEAVKVNGLLQFLNALLDDPALLLLSRQLLAQLHDSFIFSAQLRVHVRCIIGLRLVQAERLVRAGTIVGDAGCLLLARSQLLRIRITLEDPFHGVGQLRNLGPQLAIHGNEARDR